MSLSKCGQHNALSGTDSYVGDDPAASQAAAAVMPDVNGVKLLIASFICLIMAISVLCSSCVTDLPSWSLYCGS